METGTDITLLTETGYPANGCQHEVSIHIHRETGASTQVALTLPILGGNKDLAILRLGQIHSHIVMTIHIGETLYRLYGGAAFALMQLQC